jgi:hypothetical protein
MCASWGLGAQARRERVGGAASRAYGRALRAAGARGALAAAPAAAAAHLGAARCLQDLVSRDGWRGSRVEQSLPAPAPSRVLLRCAVLLRYCCVSVCESEGRAVQARRAVWHDQRLPPGPHGRGPRGVGRGQRGLGPGRAAAAHHGAGAAHWPGQQAGDLRGRPLGARAARAAYVCRPGPRRTAVATMRSTCGRPANRSTARDALPAVPPQPRRYPLIAKLAPSPPRRW